ncbi:MAG: MBL fold metallo-hydrolase [Mycobacteriales bacterium]
MLVAGFPAGSFGTNCYVAATAAGEECVVIDPGQDAVPGLDELLREHRLRPVAVLLTHGHIDHTWSVVPVCGARGIPAWIHPDDRAMLADPGRGLGLTAGTPLFGGLTFSEPDDVRELTDGATLELAGLTLAVRHAPGHTQGSVVFLAAEVFHAAEVLFAGDLLFAGSIGRTDLPGGSYPQILHSLARVVLPLADHTAVLPGHGPATSVGEERQTNPFLAEAAPLAPGRVRGL